MAVAHRTVLITLALATSVSAGAFAAPAFAAIEDEDPAPAIIEGSVINVQNSRTIPRASVTLMGLKGSGSRSARADGNGHFIFPYVKPGVYKLMAERQGFFSDESKREYQPVFEVASGAHLKNMPVRLMPTAVVSGEVVDEFSEPLQNIAVKLLAMRTRLGQIYLTQAGKTVTDDRGQYRIAGLHPGRYYLVAETKPADFISEQIQINIAQQMSEPTNALRGPKRSEPLTFDVSPTVPEPAFTYPPLFYPATSDFQQAQPLLLSPGDEISANFIFFSAPVVSIRGRVTNGMTGGPAGKATVTAFWTEYVEGEGLPAQVSSQDGTFEVRAVAPGTYTLRTTFTDGEQAYAGETTVEVGNQGAQNVEIPGLPDFAANGHVSITGDLRNPVGRVIIEFAGEGMTPRVLTNAGAPQFLFGAQFRPGKRYHAVVRSLPDDYYLKSVALAGHEMPTNNVVVSGLRGDLELTLSPNGGHIEGVLFDEKNQPARGSILLVPDVPQPGPPDLFRRTSADGKGKFALRGVAPGSYRLLALESVALDTEINNPEFLSTIGNRGESVIVEENGTYAITVKIAVMPESNQ